MAAGQGRKQLTNPKFHEECRGKKKRRLDSSDNTLYLRSQVDLEWDVIKKRVVAKKEQIGLRWTDMAPFVNQSNYDLADVVSVPNEIFDLDSLSEVLTYEVWTSLAEPDTNLLSQFLPSGSEIEQVVYSLLKGENHHFGNPYLKWSSSLCAGNLHPDVVLHLEKKFKLNKRASYYEIDKYHTGMLAVLKKWKERWLNCKDPDKFLSEGFIEDNSGKITISAERAKIPNVSEGEMSFNNSISSNDSAKYFSCIKLTRSQFQLVKNLKVSGDGIQPKSLIHVLGDVNSFHVQSYGKFEEEEKKKLHEHWLLVATGDIPAAFRVYKERKLQMEHFLKSFSLELAEQGKLMLDKDTKLEKFEILPQESTYSAVYYDHHKHAPDAQEKKDVCLRYKAINADCLEHIPSISSNQKTVCSIINNQAIEQDTSKQEDVLSPVSESLYSQNASIALEGSISSMKDLWQPPLTDASYLTSSHDGYLFADELSLGRKHISKEHQAYILDLERDFANSDIASLFYKASILPSSANQDRSVMLPAFPDESSLLSSHAHEQINNLQQPALHSFMSSEVLSDSGQFDNQFQEQPQLLHHNGNGLWQRGSYMLQPLNRNMYATCRYPSKGQFLTVDQQEFAAIQPSENSSSIGYNWLPADNQAYSSSWSGLDSLSNCHGAGDEGNANGNLSCVFSNKLTSPLDTVSSEQDVQMRGFIGGPMPTSENNYGYFHTQLASLGNDDTTVAPLLRNGSLMNFPFQNPAFQNPGLQAFLRPWNS